MVTTETPFATDASVACAHPSTTDPDVAMLAATALGLVIAAGDPERDVRRLTRLGRGANASLTDASAAVLTMDVAPWGLRAAAAELLARAAWHHAGAGDEEPASLRASPRTHGQGPWMFLHGGTADLHGCDR